MMRSRGNHSANMVDLFFGAVYMVDLFFGAV